MNFFDYIGVSKDAFVENYLHEGLVSEAIHKEFPLNIFTYSRKCVHDNVWDGVTSKCRGIIVNRDTDEIVARPFEKFHNWGSSQAEVSPEQEPWVIEKLDGFMVTGYRWNEKWYAASKGSFHSIHAKWATAEIQKSPCDFPDGFTPVFEGLHRDLRIVVDYGRRQGLVLLALINNETGEELPPLGLKLRAKENGFEYPRIFPVSLDTVVQQTTQTRPDGLEEGYVLTWFRPGKTPFRLKLKFIEYLRLHRLVTGVSPKRIWEALSQAHLKADLDEYLTQSTPWFTKFVTKWVTALRGEFDRLKKESESRFYAGKDIVRTRWDRCQLEFCEIRKAYAEEFTRPENKEFSPILFAMLDGKDVSAVIWKRVRTLTTNGHPMVDAHTT